MNMQQEPEEDTGMKWKHAFMLIVGIIVVGIVGTVVVLALPTIRQLAPFAGIVITVTITLAIPTLAVCAVLYILVIASNKHFQGHLTKPNQHGAYGALWAKSTWQQPVNAPLPIGVQVPQTITYHNAPRITGVTEQHEAPLQIGGPAGISIQQPRLSEVMGKLTRNALQVYWGRREDGGDCIITLADAMHTQKSGRTGLGKSYLTTSELYCLHTMNDPGLVQFVYIDLEGETTEPYWEAPHVWQYPVKDEQEQVVLRPAIVRDLDEVEVMFTAINQELAFRDKHKGQEFPYLLIVIEEAEELTDALAELPKAEQKTIMRLWKRIARRGRKRRILLDINVQNTYTDPIMRTAQRQFQLKITAAQQPSTAKSGGFQDLDLLKRLEAAKQKGLFIVSHESGEYLIFAPLIDVDTPDFVEADQEARNPHQDWRDDDDEDLPEVLERPAIREIHGARQNFPEVKRRNTDSLVNEPVARLPKTSEPTSETSRYQFTTEERPIVINLYKKFGTIDDVLAAFGRGGRWQASASAILREAGLL